MCHVFKILPERRAGKTLLADKRQREEKVERARAEGLSQERIKGL